jgi:hypothetical protein
MPMDIHFSAPFTLPLNDEIFNNLVAQVVGMSGSSIAEAVCKTVVRTLATRTGLRWTPQGLDAVLAGRTAMLNDSYDAFCEQHSLLVA